MIHLSKKPTVGPGGKNIFEEQYVNLGTMLAHKQMRIGELTQQLLIAKSFPKPDFNSAAGSREQRIAQLETQKKKCMLMLAKCQGAPLETSTSEPAAIEYARILDQVMDELDELRSIKTEMAESPDGR